MYDTNLRAKVTYCNRKAFSLGNTGNFVYKLYTTVTQYNWR